MTHPSRHTATGTTAGLSAALHGLAQTLDAQREQGVQLGNWRWVVRQRMAEVRDHLIIEGESPADGWLAARGGTMLRERNALLMRLSTLGPQILESPEVETIATRGQATGRRHPPPPAAAPRPRLRRGRAGARRIRVAVPARRRGRNGRVGDDVPLAVTAL